MNLQTVLLFKIAFFLLVLVPIATPSNAEGLGDSLRIKKIKRYIRPCIYYNSFGSPRKSIDDSLLGDYRFKQRNLGFYIPVLTKTWIDEDSVRLNTFHLLLNGNVQSSRITFGDTQQQNKVVRFVLGMRAIYTQGKNVWFFHLSPFIAQDTKSLENPVYRFSSGFLFNRTVSKTFSYRLGVERTYTFGKRLYLPIIGFRFGALDAFNVSIQLPRSVSFNFPIGRKVYLNVYAKPNGGIYTLSNSDSAYASFGDKITFARKDILSGIQFNFFAGRSFSFFVSTGFAHSRKIYLLDRSEPDGSKMADVKLRVDPSVFFNLGLSIRLGKAKQVFNNNVMYDVFNVNNLYTAGNNINPQSGDIPPNAEKNNLRTINKIKYKDIEDLMMDE